MQSTTDPSARQSPSASNFQRNRVYNRDAALPLTFHRRLRKSKEDDFSHREEQLQAYTAWVNSQLRKRAGSRVIQDLPRDMKDGVAFIQLIEVVAGECLKLNENPMSMSAMKENIDQVLQFMAVNKIKMHHTSSKEILEGSLKATMRLILALAAHFKPGSVKQTVHNPNLTPTTAGHKVKRTPSAAAAASDAAAAIAEASRAAANVGRHVPARLKKHRADMMRKPKIEIDRSSVSSSSTSSPMLPASDSPLPGTPRKLSKSSNGDTPMREARSGRSTPGSGSATPRRWQKDGSEYSGSDVESGITHSKKKAQDNRVAAMTADFLYELSLDHEAMDEDLVESKDMLLELQKLLLDGRVEEDEVPPECVHLEGTNLQDQLTIVNGRLNQQTAEYDFLKSERNKYKEECINLQGMKSGLMSRMNQQEEVIMQLKSELLKHGFAQQNRDADMMELQRKVEDRDAEIVAMRSELLQREKAMDRQRAEMEDALRDMEQLRFAEAASGRHGDEVYELRQRIMELQEQLQAVTTQEADISTRIASQDQKMMSLEQKILAPQSIEYPGHNRPSTDEMDMVREAIESLRECFRSHDPHHHTLDTLEQTITSLLDRPVLSNGGLGREDGEVNGVEYTDKFGYVKLVHRGDGYNSRAFDRDSSGASTKVLYFTEKTVTPFLTSIPRRLGDITLRDFKQMFDRPGPYRFHFKALDPEFGTVKEEVIDDDDVIPGWEGKIVAWVEEDLALLPYHHPDSSHDQNLSIQDRYG